MANSRHPQCGKDGTPLDTEMRRRLSVRFGVDPKSIFKESLAPGSVRGAAGHRARAALAAFAEETSGQSTDQAANTAVGAR